LNEILKLETIVVGITILCLAATLFLVFVFHTTASLVLYLKLLSTSSRYYFNISYDACKIVYDWFDPEIS